MQNTGKANAPVGRPIQKHHVTKPN